MQPTTQPQTAAQLAAMRQRPKGTYIFYGPAGVGKMTTVRWLAKSWHGHETSDLSCKRCLQIDAGTYPDLVIIEPEKSTIGIAQIQDLQKTLNLSRHDTLGFRVIAIDQAQHLTHEAQNALLKSAEEPPADTIILLLASTLNTLLTTILSRSQKIRFLTLPNSIIIDFLVKHGSCTPTQAQQIAEIASGKLGIAMQLSANPTLLQQHQEAAELAKQLSLAPLFERLTLVSQVADSKNLSLELFSESLQTHLRKQLRLCLEQHDTLRAASTTRALAASIRLHKHLNANVTPKMALGALALGLS